MTTTKLTKDEAIDKIHRFLSDSKVARKLSKAAEKAGYNADMCISGIISVLRNATPEKKSGLALWDCTPASLLTAIMDSLQHDIIIDGRGLAYLIRKGSEAKFRPSYKGYINTIKKANPTVNFDVGFVFDGEEFTVSKTDNHVTYFHKINTPFPTKVDLLQRLVGAYCYLTYSIEGKSYAVLERMAKEEIDKVKSKAETDGVWNEWLSEQIKKTILRRTCKVPFAGVVSRLEMLDNEDYVMNNAEIITDTDNGRDKWKELARQEEETLSKLKEKAQPNLKKEEPPLIIDNEGEPLAISYLPEEEMSSLEIKFPNDDQEAYDLLYSLIKTSKDKEERKAILDDNLYLIERFIKNKSFSDIGDKVSELHQIASEGDND